jgi:hypothetical protein
MNLLFPKDGSIVDTYTSIQREFIDRIATCGIETALEWLLPIKDGMEISYPEAVDFLWEGGASPYTLELSTSSNMSDAVSYVAEEPSLSVGNLLVGTEYFWRVNGSRISSFKTNDGFCRFVKIDGLPNVRDIGGGNIKQGLLFRGGELERCYKITDEGKRAFVEELGIKTELDLRADMIGRITESAAGGSVRLVQLPYRPYDEVFEDQHRQGIVKIMEFLSDENNYPVYFHCLGGADRTGMIALYLRALADEDDETIHEDYELTSLSAYAMGIAEGAAATGFRKRTSEYYSDFIKRLMNYSEDGSLSSAVKGFLLDCGVKVSILEKIRKVIMR